MASSHKQRTVFIRAPVLLSWLGEGEPETSMPEARRSMVRKGSRRSSGSATSFLPRSTSARRTLDLRVMSQSRGSGTLQRTGCQINPTVALEFSRACWIAWTDHGRV